MNGLQEFCKLLMALGMLGVCKHFWRGLWFALDYQRCRALKRMALSHPQDGAYKAFTFLSISG